MTTQTLVGSMIIPTQHPYNAGRNPIFASSQINADGEKYAFILQAPATGSIDQIEIRVNTVTVAGNIDFRLETVSNVDGNPTGTLLATTTNIVQSVSATGWNTATLTSTASVTIGDLIAVVMEVPVASGTDININSMDGGNWASKYPYSDLFTTSWAINSASPVVALRYTGANYYPILGSFPVSNIAAINTADPVALRFRLPIPTRLIGIWAYVDNDNDMTIELDGVSLLAVDSNTRSGTADGIQRFLFTAPQAIAKDTFYRIAINGTLAVYTGYFDFNSTAQMAALDGGADFHYSQFTSGAWVDTLTRRPLIGLLLDQFDDAAGGGGGSGVAKLVGAGGLIG